MKWLTLAVVWISFFASAQENSLGFPQNPRTNILSDSSVYSKGLASACLSLISIPDDLPCAASNLVFDNNSLFSAQLALSNGYSSLNLIREAIGSEISSEFIDLILEQKTFQIDTGIRVYFKSKNFAGKYVPMSVRGFIGLRNEVNPNVDVFAIEEKGFYFQLATTIFNKNISIGTQIRALDRTLVKSTFKVSEFGADNNDDLVKSEPYKVFYLDPSITYRVPKFYDLIITGMLMNIGSSDLENRPDVEEPIAGRLSASALIKLNKYGGVRTILEYGRQNYTEDFMNSLNFSAEYSYGGMKAIGGINTYGMSAGVYFGLSDIQAGIIYTSSRFPNLNEESYIQTVYVELGWRSK